MNGIDKITARIETDAVADAARLAEETKRQCEAIQAEGEKKAQERYWEKVRQGVATAEDRVQRLAKTADMESRKSVLGCKQALVAQAFDKAEERLRALAGEDYVNVLVALALRASTSGTEELVLTARDKKLFGEKVLEKANAALEAAGKAGRLTIADEDGDFDRGLICREGSVGVNCAFGSLMAQARETMAADVAAALFN